MTNAKPLQQAVASPLEQSLKQAVAHHQNDRLRDAERLYRAILQIQPKHSEANHNLGILAIQQEQPDVGLSHLRAALEAAPNQGQYWLSYIDALIRTGHTDDARQVLEQGRQLGLQGVEVDTLAARLGANALVAVQSLVENRDAFNGPSSISPIAPPPQENNPNPQEIATLVALFTEQRYIEAAALAQSMTIRFPLYGFGWKALGAVYRQMGRSADALEPMKKAVLLLPSDAETYSNLGNTLKDLGRLDEAEASYRRALEIGPDYAEAHSNLGVTLQDQGRLFEAEACYRRTLEIKPNYAEAHSNLGNILKALRQLDEAEASYRKALTIKPDFAEAHNNLGNTLQNQGRLNEAEASYNKALEIKPDYAQAYCNLGNTLYGLDRLNEAEASYLRALELEPDFAEAYNNMGNTLQELGKLDEAEASYRRTLESMPDFVEAHNNLGNLLQNLGRIEEAEACYRRALEISPDYAEACSNLGVILQDQGRLSEAEACYRRTLELKPDYAEAHNNLGNTLLGLGRLDEAESCYRRALEIKPDFVEAHYNLGNIFKEMGRLDKAEVSYRIALEFKPSFAEAHSNLGNTLHDMGRLDEAEESCRQALMINPDLVEAHNNLGNTLQNLGRLDEAKACYRNAHRLGFYGARIREALMLPPIMGTRQEILESRATFERNLDELIAEATILDDPLKAVGAANFYLAYHGLNDRDLQVKVAKYYEQTCPALLYEAPHCSKVKSDAQKKIRIGFLSKFLYTHSVSLCFSKIIETLSLKEQFEVTLISNHALDRKIYSEFSGQHVRLPDNLPRAREMVAVLELDILVYLDIGMEPLSYFLAFSRLAPVQCVLSGHPVTTGITNIDYYLSNELIEPHNAEKHYSEKLVRLSKPLFYFKRPILPAKLKSRHELDLPEGRHIYMCPMVLQKLHPDFDEAITRILQIDNNGVVVLFEDHSVRCWKNIIMQRFEQTVPAEFRERIIFLPWLKELNDFTSAIAVADVILDPFHFGIGSTAITAFSTGTPLVTKSGEFLRGRVGMGLCRMIDMTECIAEDTETYAQKAFEIADNTFLREELRAKILKNNSVIYENMEPISSLTDFLSSVIPSRRIA